MLKDEKRPMIFIRALRLPFITASVLPFILGSALAGERFSALRFFFGLIAVMATHLGANLMNDYADSTSGVDWKDTRFYGFFGGSKLIQEGVLSEGFYVKWSCALFFIGLAAVALLAVLMRTLSVMLFYLAISFLAFAYSKKPLQFSYCRLGEPTVFLLFGPASVMGGYFIQTAVFPSAESFYLSLPLGFLTASILFVNEIPDYREDMASGKMTWVSFTGPEKAFIVYYLLVFLAFFSIAVNIIMGYLNALLFFSLLCAIPAFRAVGILKKYPTDKEKLVAASKLTILLHLFVGAILIAAVLIWR